MSTSTARPRSASAVSGSELSQTGAWFNAASALLGTLVPAVEVGEVAGLPGLPQPGGGEVPVRADLAGDLAQVLPELVERRTPPEPVAVVDLVHDQPGLEHD